MEEFKYNHHFPTVTGLPASYTVRDAWGWNPVGLKDSDLGRRALDIFLLSHTKKIHPSNMVHYQHGASITLKPLLFWMNNAALIFTALHAVNISSLQMFASVFVAKLSSRWKMNGLIVSAFASLSMQRVALLHGPVGRTDRPVNQKQRLIWPLGAEHKARFTSAALLTSGFSIRLIISYWPFVAWGVCSPY